MKRSRRATKPLLLAVVAVGCRPFKSLCFSSALAAILAAENRTMVFAKLFSEAQKKRKSNETRPKPRAEKQQRPLKKRPRKSGDDQHDPQQATQITKKNEGRGPPGVPPNKQRKRGPPSAEALEFSRRLKELSRQKRLDQAVRLYWDNVHIHQADQHHACIVVDCAARCGDVTAAERIVEHLQQQEGEVVSVETQTALLKGYAHAGKMKQAVELFRRIPKPNVRTLNTLLRGCLWAAATRDPITGEIFGGVVSSEQAWKLYQSSFPDAASTLDVSSYEYSIALLCQALRTQEAEERIEVFQKAHSVRVKGTASIVGGEQGSLETLAVVYLGLSRAYALLSHSKDMWRTCQRALSAIKGSRALLLESGKIGEHTLATKPKKNQQKNQKGASGGKRGWKSSHVDHKAGNNTSTTRESSNIAFRTHRLSELETEVRSLLKSRGKNAKEIGSDQMARHIQNQLLYFSGGGTTDASASQGQTPSAELSENDHLVSAWESFGLSHFALEEEDRESLESSVDPAWICRRCGFGERASPVGDDGKIQFESIFKHHKRPLDIEIGAGFGTWIVQQAQENEDRNYVAVELRSDRVAQIFARAMLDCTEPLDNLCVVGSECGSLLRDRITKASVSTIFANHPEPPTQTHGDDRNDLRSIINEGKEPAHMLNSRCIIEMGKCLEPNGKIVVVSDNRFYARLLAATFARVVRQDPKLIRSVKPSELKNSSLRHTESFANSVDLYEGRPDREIGHAKKSGSYFDRLWRTGAGSHAERQTRFVILMQRSK